MIDSYNLTTVLDIRRMSGGKEQSIFTVPNMDSKKTTKQQQKCIIPTSTGNGDVTVKTLYPFKAAYSVTMNIFSKIFIFFLNHL